MSWDAGSWLVLALTVQGLEAILCAGGSDSWVCAFSPLGTGDQTTRALLAEDYQPIVRYPCRYERTDWNAQMTKPLVSGEIVFETKPETLSGARIRVKLEETSLADALSRVVAEQVLTDLPADAAKIGHVPFVLFGELPDPRERYTVSVHVDLQGDGKVNSGDYLTIASYPVLTYGYPNHLMVYVRRI